MKHSILPITAVMLVIAFSGAGASLPASVEHTEEQPIAWALSERECVAFGVFAEARGKSALEQAAIAAVIRNRMDGTDVGGMCEVVATMPELLGVQAWQDERAPWAIDEAAWLAAQLIVEAVWADDYAITPWRCGQAIAFTPDGAAPLA